MEQADDTEGSLTLRQSKSSCHKTPEKKGIFRENKENNDFRKLEREENFLDFRSSKKLKTSESVSNVTPEKEKSLLEHDIFKTPEKKKNNNTITVLNNYGKSSPQKKEPLKEESIADSCSRSEPLSLETADEDLISEIDQAKLLIAETKNFPKYVDKTPVKDSNSQSPSRVPTNSPGTPGRQKRVELITLASPKSKILKLM